MEKLSVSIGILRNFLEKRVDWDLARTTRAHPLPASHEERLWIKREDELSSGISGSKLRKYASLLPQIKSEGITHVGIIGGYNSNNLLGLAQILKENSIGFTLFLRRPGDNKRQGNSLFLSLLTNETQHQIIAPSDWSKVESVAQSYLDQHFSNHKTLLLGEGCFSMTALIGCMSLALDVLENERRYEKRFQRIYIDAGTGLSAAGLVLGLEIADYACNESREATICHLADSSEVFLQKLEALRSKLYAQFNISHRANIRLRHIDAPVAKKFGTVTPSIIDACKNIAAKEGILMDPVYSVKHYMACKKDLAVADPAFDSLFIYNGSTLGLTGFLDRLT